MFAEWFWRKQMGKVYEAFESMDAERLARLWAEDAVLEFPAGTPMAGPWRGRAEIEAILRAIFAHNASISVTPHRVAVYHPWSPTGSMTVFAAWTFNEVGRDGHTYRGDVVSRSEIRRWKTVHTRDCFSNVPGNAEHYATMEVPPRRAPAEHVR